LPTQTEEVASLQERLQERQDYDDIKRELAVFHVRRCDATQDWWINHG